MEIIKNSFEIELNRQIERYFTESTMLFDIECLGLNSKYSGVYLIGYLTRKGTTVTEVQIFANHITEEKEVLLSFCEAMTGYDTVVSFNGTRFDEPFLIDRMTKYAVEHPFKGITHIDLYKKCIKARDLLNLPNYKQKTFEAFLGVGREDMYDGGKLIDVYKEYDNSGSEELKKLLLIHNYEDVMNMIHLFDVTSYVDLMDFKQNFEIIESEESSDNISFTFRTEIKVPKAVNVKKETGTLYISGDCLKIVFPKYKMLLNSYFKNFSDYYYNEKDNILIPVQLLSGVDKNDYKKASKEDAKISFEGDFIRIPYGMKDEAGRTLFKENVDSKEIYIRTVDIDANFAERLIKTFL